ncbi:DUF397 domain-containing protein [Marinitenerispora sediminis]|uniref:DUF397 domain-containing protein n=1 Tax=Marinitenerispora sediminis TaxID=1931232 RepID=A0A368T5S3_9ACTN|nr:DUF397 domain-containing protein [Marinitenerispora sediminis]RCV53241.1 DUF397 domain-containing protein [Marinitenerispora sediminis]RCV54940.1 DUF397 domain-containing protein [Marinitenerispora sediminis]RCV59063.1 DUF397 domain-containing protein [Marinitenerispora sediminis]
MRHSRVRWRTSSYSAASSNNCVEVADLSGASAVRDTRNRDKATLVFAATEWRAFLAAVKRREL